VEQRLYTIYDLKAESPVGVIQWFSTDAQAARMFSSVIQAPGSLIHEHPGDFVLLFLGTISFSSLAITPNLNSRMLPVASGDAIVRASTRARNVDTSSVSAAADVMRDQLSLDGAPRPVGAVGS